MASSSRLLLPQRTLFNPLLTLLLKSVLKSAPPESTNPLHHRIHIIRPWLPVYFRIWPLNFPLLLLRLMLVKIYCFNLKPTIVSRQAASINPSIQGHLSRPKFLNLILPPSTTDSRVCQGIHWISSIAPSLSMHSRALQSPLHSLFIPPLYPHHPSGRAHLHID